MSTNTVIVVALGVLAFLYLSGKKPAVAQQTTSQQTGSPNGNANSQVGNTIRTITDGVHTILDDLKGFYDEK